VVVILQIISIILLLFWRVRSAPLFIWVLTIVLVVPIIILVVLVGIRHGFKVKGSWDVMLEGIEDEEK
jgi:hypothetical protein